VPSAPLALALLALLALLAVSFACNDSDKELVEKLFSPQANELDVYDISQPDAPMTVLIPAERNNVNGQVCPLPDGSGNMLMGEDTGQSEGERQGWGIFNPEGELVDKIVEPETPNEPAQIEPFGCAFDSEERLFVSDVGSGNFDATDGKLIVFFPPDYEEFCLLDSELRVPGTIALDDEGAVYISETVPPGHVLRFAPPFPESADDCDSVVPERTTFIADQTLATPFGIVRAPNGNWYVSSVFLPRGIREYDTSGRLVRTIVEGETVGSPAGLAVDSAGTLYYADLAIVQREGELPGPAGGQGTVRRITFDAEGNPSEPEIIGEGFDYPDAVSVLKVEAE
jgi:sugar lactone lactonase YvrE